MAVGSSKNNVQQGSNRAGDRLANADPPRATVVVLDDDLLFRRGVSRVLRSEGFDVIEVEGSAELAEVLQESSVDLIVADSRLADGSDGWREAKALAKEHGDIKVIAMTGYDPDAIAAVGGFTEVDGWIQKAGAGFNVVRAVEEALFSE